MNKYLLSLVLMAAPMTMCAQLKVASTGNVGIGSYSPIPNSFLSINSYSYNTNYNHAITARLYPISGKFNTGFCSIAHSESVISSGRTIGLQGVGGNLNLNFGVIGGMVGNKPGAGVYGTLTNTTGVEFTGQYAGYFDGNVFVDGTVTANSIDSESDSRLQENVRSISEEGSTLESILDMNVIKYNYKKKETADSDTATVNVRADSKKYKKTHYGLSAQELQKIYPELVDEGQEGYLCVNYIELVPVLIRSIQELKAELDEARNAGEANMTRGGATDISASAQTGNVLYQNTPNPFKEQTIIRFRLADDAANAAICIFDMTGKMLKKLPISSGMESVTVNGFELGEGLFLYTLMVNNQEIDTKRMILSK